MFSNRSMSMSTTSARGIGLFCKMERGALCGELVEFAALTVNRRAVKKVSPVIHRIFWLLFHHILSVNLKNNFTGETVKHFYQIFTGSSVKNSPP